jgi:hypothetical protein
MHGPVSRGRTGPNLITAVKRACPLTGRANYLVVAVTGVDRGEVAAGVPLVACTANM